MGQTLSHGVYLPAEGERNCYSGLASNWNLLDTAIGDTAGKASATHTHGNISNDGKVGTTANLPLITGTGGAVQAGVFGNQANTFCEGNDSRLSDARTPVAHTHTKSDVTDLLNSNFIPSANNSYDLGSSSYQWNNLYAKNYYYNGTAWGLDQANVWTNAQIYSTAIFGQMIWLKNTDLDLSVNGNAELSSTCQHIINWCDKNNTVYSVIQSWTNQYENVLVLRSKYRTDANTVRDLSVRFASTATNNVVYPETNADTDLGRSTNKWKTLNGIDPGALSLPNGNAQDTSWIGDLTIKDGSNYNLKTFALNGWITINIPNTAGNLVVVNNGCGQIITNEANGITGNNCAVFMPVVANVQISILLVLQTGESVKTAIFAPCLGNV